MKQKKSLLALTLVFALIFTSFAGVGNAEAKNSKQMKRYKTSKSIKTKIGKNTTPFLNSKEKAKYKGALKGFKRKRSVPLYEIDSKNQWKYIGYNKKKPATTVICSKAMFKTLSPKNKRKVRRIEKKLRAQLQRALLAKQYVKLDKYTTSIACPIAMVACEIANRENQKLHKYNIKARKINKTRYRVAKKRWKKRHRRGKIRYRKMKIKKYLDAQKLCKNANINPLDVDYTLEKNDNMPVHDSVQAKLTWNSKKNNKHHVVKIEEEAKSNNVPKIEVTVDSNTYLDSKKYVIEDMFGFMPATFLVYSMSRNKLNVFYNAQNYDSENEGRDFIYSSEMLKELAKYDDEEYQRTGLCEGFNYISLLSLNKLRDKVGLKPVKYSAEMNKYANIRAKESARLFDHIRPDGSLIDTVFPEEKRTDNLIDEQDKSKWQIESEGLSKVNGIQGLWDHLPHREDLINKETTHVAIGMYGEYLVAIPIITGEEGVKNLTEKNQQEEEYQKNKEEFARKFLSKCGIDFNDHLNEKNVIYNRLATLTAYKDDPSIWFWEISSNPELIKQVYYKGMSLTIFDQIHDEINKTVWQNDDSPELHQKLKEIWQKWIDKHKQYK